MKYSIKTASDFCLDDLNTLCDELNAVLLSFNHIDNYIPNYLSDAISRFHSTVNNESIKRDITED